MKPLTFLTRNLRAWLVLLSAGVLFSFLLVLSHAQEDERELNNTVPKHLPIQVKLKQEKEKSFKDMKNEKWVSEFELEVKNTGDRPIYFLHLMLVLPETIVGGNPLVFPFYYGRNELSQFKNAAQEDDIPIYPGETHTFTIHRGMVSAWEKRVKEGRPQPHKVELHFVILSFGDHTGYIGNDGERFVPRSQRPGVSQCVDPPKLPTRNIDSYLPASILPVNFLSTGFSFGPVPNAPVDECCPGQGCEYVEFIWQRLSEL